MTEINESVFNFGNWLTTEDEFSDVVISSRVRLARNVKGYSFPNRGTKEELTRLLKKVRNACTNCSSLTNAEFINMNKLSQLDRKYFVERRLASPQLIESRKPSLIVVGFRENLSVMVNEEDHLRIQCLESGLSINRAWSCITNLDDELEKNLKFSYSNKFGYLTACPTNIGTGLRVSIFVHMPAIEMQQKINSIIKELPTSEIAVRGFYGEGSDPIGSIFQISNQLTLGRTERSIICRMIKTAEKLIEIEREARDILLNEERIALEDNVFRALAILKNARLMNSMEAIQLLSAVRFGVELGIVKEIERLTINQLLVLVQPAHLQKIYNKKLDAQQRDIIRAEFLRQNLLS